MDDVFEKIREKTEEDNLDSVLTGSFGGYSKKSVVNYFVQLRRLQQEQNNGYEEEIKRILSEKEKLRAENERLKDQTIQPEQQTDKGDTFAQQYHQLKNEYTVLERDMDEAIERIKSDEVRIKQLMADLEEEKGKFKQAINEVADLRLATKDALEKSETQNKLVMAKNEEINRLKEELANRNQNANSEALAELKKMNNKLIASVKMLQSELEAKENDLKQKESHFITLNEQERKNSEAIELLQDALSTMNSSNEELKVMVREMDEMQKTKSAESLELKKVALAYRAKYMMLAQKLEKVS
ncbi:MAG: hypothetical protein HUJ58_10305 [Erysipelotrichaceae bacterium]|nr:hypothetical protein [Erysipelotrichaceae bacterium]